MRYNDVAIDSIKELMDNMDWEIEHTPNSEEVEEINIPGKIRFFEKFEFTWTPEEKIYLTIIKASAENVIAELLGQAMLTIEYLYAQARVAAKTASGRPLKDEDGRQVWERDDAGNIKQDWASISNADLENAILSLHQLKFDVTSSVADLYLEAVFAKNAYKDGFNDKYHGIVAGTVNDRTAAAERAYRKEKYKAFSRFWLWYKANEFKREIESTIKSIENMRNGRNWEKN